MILKWNATPQDFDVIVSIAKRAVLLAQENGIDYPQQMAVMDLNAVHCNACPLRLQELLAADNGNFIHDVFGIRRHLDRTTGQLRDCFVPRFADPGVRP